MAAVGLSLAWFSAVGVQAQLPAVRVEGVAALVGDKATGSDVSVILLSDVALRARLNLARRGQVERAATASLPAALLRASLQELIGEELIVREARRIRTAEPSPRDVRAERERLTEACGGGERLDNLLSAFDVSDAEWTAIVRRRALVAAFLTSNLEGATTVTEGQVDAALAEAGHGDPASASPEARRIVAAALARAALSRSVERWVRVLRARVPVREYARFDSP